MSVDFSVVKDLAGLSALEPAWRELAQLGGAGALFRGPDWLMPWWHAYHQVLHAEPMVLVGRVDGELVAEIGAGLLVLLGVTHDDDGATADRLADKVRALRVFPDAEGRMNEPLGDREALVVSQFTLYGDTSRGNRPSYVEAAPGDVAEPLYERLCEARREEGVSVETGVFGARMEVSLVNDGPVTIVLDV